MNETGLITFICEQYGISFYLKGERTFLEKSSNAIFFGGSRVSGEKMELPTFCYSHFEQQNIDPWIIKKLKNTACPRSSDLFYTF